MLNDIKNRFMTDEIEIKRDDLYKVVVAKEKVFELIEFLDKKYKFNILHAITCADWIEDDNFAITYMLAKDDRTVTFMVQTLINRDNASLDSISYKYKQAQIMERDLHEMYGIGFEGNDNLVELSLENWIHTPPLRREFDSLEFVNEYLTFREGRDDNVDTKVEMKRLRAIKKAAKEAAKKEEEEQEDGK